MSKEEDIVRRRTKSTKKPNSNNMASNKNNTQKKRKKVSKKKMKMRRRIFFSVLIVLLLALITGGTYVYKLLNKLDSVELDKTDLGLPSTEELKEYDNHNKIKNIALFGVDSSDGVGRSDAIMIATVDPVHDKLKVTSLMRDTYVNIEGYGYDKLNHAYAFGGPQLAIKTLNQNFGLNIENFATVDFASLPVLIDMVGGMELTITEEEITCDPNLNDYIYWLNQDNGTNSKAINSPGTYQVDGTQAVAYSRIRYTSGGDYERTQRQRTVLNGIFEKVMNISPTKYLTLIEKMLPYVSTNMTATEILNLGTKVVGIGGGSLEQERFPRDGYCQGDLINGVYYLTFDEEETKKQMQDYLFDDIK